ncbi:hypothetical protein [Clostridium tagluense]|uniref:hypothetical protein n=1 Tax=Clostridium tagluense TaxID=360422 RepID=UPI001CF4FF8F|nr:hypothetical protein [Clostridium tagluense]MCB2300100.1 hypothetical protein [Clostridium tagluense]
MNNVTIANLNIELEIIDTDFFDKRLHEYKNTTFGKSDMTLKTNVCDEIAKPEGVIIEQINNVAIVRIENNKFCRYLRSSETGEIVNAFYYTKDYSKVEIHLRKNQAHPVFSLTDFEYMYTGLAFSDRLTKLGGVVLHGSSIEYKRQGIIFSANSGIGKSTHTNLWKERFGDEVAIVNDDKPAIRFYKDMPYVFGTPWSGKTDLNTNIQVPLKAIIFIKRAETNWIEKLQVRDSVFNLTEQIWRPYYDTEIGEKTLDVIEKLISTVPIYRLHCSINQESVTAVLNKLFAGE